MGEEKTQDTIKSEPILFGWRKKKGSEEEIKPESVISGRAFSIIIGIFTVIFGILELMRGNIEELMTLAVIILGIITNIIAREDKKKKKEKKNRKIL